MLFILCYINFYIGIYIGVKGLDFGKINEENKGKFL